MSTLLVTLWATPGPMGRVFTEMDRSSTRAWHAFHLLGHEHTWNGLKWVCLKIGYQIWWLPIIFPMKNMLIILGPGGIPASDTPKSWSLLRPALLRLWHVPHWLRNVSDVMRCGNKSRLRKQRIPLKNHVELKGLSENRLREYWLTVTDCHSPYS